MQSQLFRVVVLCAVLVGAFAYPSMSQELAPRIKREAAQGFGAGGANGQSQGGTVGFSNPNGSGGRVEYGHANGQGHSVGVDGRVPVWSNKNRFGESTLNVGGGVSHQFGGPGGSHTGDKRVGVNFNHRF